MALCVLSIATLGGLGLVEGILRLVWTPPPANRVIHSFDYAKTLQPDAELGHVPRPGIRVAYPPYRAEFSTNSLGLRGPDIVRERSADVQRILVLGDSFAWGHGVSTGEAFPEIIEANLAATEVVNLGVPGYDLVKSLAYYERVGRRFRPDLVIVSICQNDFRIAPEHTTTNAKHQSVKPAKMHTVDTTPASRHFKQWLRANSCLYQLVQQAINTNKPLARMAVAVGLKEELAGFSLLDDNLRPALIDAPPEVLRSHEAVMEQVLQMRDAIRADGADLIVGLIPCIQAVDSNELAKSIAYTKYEVNDFDLDAPMDMLARFCREANIRVVNPLPAFRDAHAGGESLYLSGDLHFNAAGHALFARSLLDELAKTGAMPSPASASRVHDKARLQRPSR